MGQAKKGILVLWNDGKGFGFVRPESAEGDYFVHISAFPKSLPRRPKVGDVIHFESDDPARKQLRAVNAQIEGIAAEEAAPLPVPPKPTGADVEPWIIRLVVSFPIVASMYLLWRAGNPIPFIFYTFTSVLTILYYGADKLRAMKDRWRIPNFYLHGFEMLGGWPGALLARYRLRHKLRAGPYTRVLWGIVALHCVGWLAYFFFEARRYWF